jgi:AcrR family transcriptional regulator
MTNLDDDRTLSEVAAPGRGDPDRSEHRRRDNVLNRDKIVGAAIALADGEGAAAVNMRRIAKDLGVGAMSLYWHVVDKEQLLDLMLDVVEGESRVADLSGDWRVDFRNIASERRRVLLTHPWAADFMSNRKQLGPNALLRVEQSLSVLDGVDLDARTALKILMTMDGYVTGTVLNELREIRVEETQARDGLSDAEISEGFEDWMGRLDDSGQFKRVLRIFREGIDPDAAETRDERFEFGLDCVLDGVAARLGVTSP